MVYVKIDEQIENRAGKIVTGLQRTRAASPELDLAPHEAESWEGSQKPTTDVLRGQESSIWAKMLRSGPLTLYSGPTWTGVWSGPY